MLMDGHYEKEYGRDGNCHALKSKVTLYLTQVLKKSFK